ncbi:hypothetical protein C8Q77DRAFT_189576 [Trametes polyzona]|nr:hypothetical protein C8Q77DRAFT_189576 [Trametes polyzona]
MERPEDGGHAFGSDGRGWLSVLRVRCRHAASCRDVYPNQPRRALLLVNIVALSLSRIPQLLTPLSIWSSGITCVLTSRFILDLQHANEVLAGGGTSARETGGGWGVNISMSALGNSRRRPVD